MLIYITILLLIFILSLFEIQGIKRDQKYILFFALLLIFVLFDGLRWETGTDWKLYKDYFYGSSRMNLLSMETGYFLFNKLVLSWTSNYTILLTLIALVWYSLYFNSIIEYSIFPFLSILLLYVNFIGYMGMNRQHLALSICLFSFRYILIKDFPKFCITVLIASTFHLTALVFLITYFLNRRFSPVFMFSILIFVYLLNPFIKDFVYQLSKIFPQEIANKMSYYLENSPPNNTLGTIIGSLKRALIFLPLFYYRDRLISMNGMFLPILNVYFCSILLYVLFNNNLQIFVNRGNLYFGSLFEIFLIPYFLLLFKNRLSRYIFLFFLGAYSLSGVIKSIHVFADLFIPYKSIIINSDYIRYTY